MRAVAVLAAGALLLTGCGEQEADAEAVNHSAPAGPSATPRAPVEPVAAEPAAAVAPTPTLRPRLEPVDEVPVENMPTELPPGDPGLDAPSVPDPGVPAHDREHEDPARTQVPVLALLDVPSVAAVLGGDWQQVEAQAPEGFAATQPVAARTVAYESDGGRFEETVATHRSLAAADRAVTSLGRELEARGWTPMPDPRLGTASLAVRSPDGARTAAIMSAEGVTATLVGSGSATAARSRWVGLLDLALGTSCEAAPHGCH
jgi:hypothetical protein